MTVDPTKKNTEKKQKSTNPVISHFSSLFWAKKKLRLIAMKHHFATLADEAHTKKCATSVVEELVLLKKKHQQLVNPLKCAN